MTAAAGTDTADYSLVYGDVFADLSLGMAVNDGFGATDTLLDIDGGVAMLLVSIGPTKIRSGIAHP